MSAHSAATEVIYAGTERNDYEIQLLALALSYFPEKNYQLKAFGEDIPKIRALQLIAKNDGLSVIPAGATNERVAICRPILFPIFKGVFGWRVPLVNKQQVRLFDKITSLAEFKKLRPGQYHSWSDTAILTHNGINVEKGSSVEGLYQMLARNRIDYFPRSILEVDYNLVEHANLNIAKAKNVLIHYPSAQFFYVSYENTELAEDLHRGLELALADGQFDKLFDRHFADTLQPYRERAAKVFRLSNPFLPADTPLERLQLWLELSQ